MGMGYYDMEETSRERERGEGGGGRGRAVSEEPPDSHTQLC